MEQASGDGRGVHLQLGKDLRHLQRMHDVGLAGGTLLLRMLRLGEGPRCPDQLLVVMGPVGAQRRQHPLEALLEV